MSPILIRPVREQIEHDRIIRVLHARLRKDFDVEANLGDDRRAALRVGQRTHHPDLVLTAIGAPRKVQGVVEVETGESVNHLEAMAEWAHYGKAKAPFYLYVPVSTVDIAKRLVDDYHVAVAELWSYATVADHVHFWLVQATVEGAPPPGTEFSVPVDGGYITPRPEPAVEPAPEPAATATPAKAKPKLKDTAPTPLPKVGPPKKPASAATASGAAPKAAKPVAKPVGTTKAAKPAKLPKPAKPAKPVKPTRPVKAAASSRPSKGRKAVKKAAPKPAPKHAARVARKPSAKKATVRKKPARPARQAKSSKRR